MYWDLTEVEQLFGNIGAVSSVFDGCAYGLKADDGRSLNKPWLVKTNSKVLADGLRRRCDRTHTKVVSR